LAAAAKLGVAPIDCIAFEDSVTGLNSAAAAGTHAIGVRNLVELPGGSDRKIIDTLVGLSAANLHELRIHE
jgi:beta-phosphoglucomutase-like phosphatase (HAD superfamily)